MRINAIHASRKSRPVGHRRETTIPPVSRLLSISREAASGAKGRPLLVRPAMTRAERASSWGKAISTQSASHRNHILGPPHRHIVGPYLRPISDPSQRSISTGQDQMSETQPMKEKRSIRMLTYRTDHIPTSPLPASQIPRPPHPRTRRCPPR